MISVFSVYLSMGMILGVLPTYIRGNLGFSTVIVGLAIGLQSLATLLTRAYAGKIKDTQGGKQSNNLGAVLMLLTGFLYLVCTFCGSNFILALVFILLARIVHGVSESVLITGSLAWAIDLAGEKQSGKVMMWNGIAIYAGIAAGAPFGIALKNSIGIGSVFTGIIFWAILCYAAPYKLPSPKVDTSYIRTSFRKVVGKVASAGGGLAFSSIGFACISSFISLLFVQKNWGNPSAAFLAFGGFFILARLLFASFPDKYGGYKVTFVSLIVEIAGLLVIAFSSIELMAVIGCGLTGIGFSLIFPALGVLAIKRVAPQMRGTALGAYDAFFDISLGIAGPIAGVIAGWYNYQAVYLFGVVSCLLAILTLMFQRKAI